MNTNEMKRHMDERIPYLKDVFKKEWQKNEKLRKCFVKDYPISKIADLELDDYVIGKGKDNKSFCYRIERELDQLGGILGLSARKFGVYYGQLGEDKRKKYRFVEHWGESLDEAFLSVKTAIENLLRDVSDINSLRNNLLSPMFKGKILFIYYPEMFINIYGKNHLEYFTALLNINTSSNNELDLHNALLEYKNSWPEFVHGGYYLFGKFLYDTFGRPPRRTEDRVAQLSDAIKGAKIVSKLNKIFYSDENILKRSKGKPDYNEVSKKRKIIGDRGEEIVKAIEIEMLITNNRRDLAKKVVHVSRTDDSAGYDILSYETNGSLKHIEVKSTCKEMFSCFNMTRNEYEKAKQLPNYCIYFVSSALSIEPKIYPLHVEDKLLKSLEFIPLSYEVRFKESSLMK